MPRYPNYHRDKRFPRRDLLHIDLRAPLFTFPSSREPEIGSNLAYCIIRLRIRVATAIFIRVFSLPQLWQRVFGDLLSIYAGVKSSLRILRVSASRPTVFKRCHNNYSR
ncbi:hypothetical protein B0H13DRAFT_1864176 [Mycena leptocephala]|nr:hypothetical protein B0H13DRAFT_1864176 [Mycena leptocephala]